VSDEVWERALADAAAPHAPADVIHLSSAQIAEHLDDEGHEIREIVDDRQREMATTAHCTRWWDYLEAWHAAADVYDDARRRDDGR
jgi:hypothetical protein